MTPKSGSWMAIVYGFGGLRTDLPVLTFAPGIPQQWNSYAFRLTHGGSVFEVSITKQAATFKLISGPEQSIQVYGKDVIVTSAGATIALQPVGATLSAAV